MRCMQAWPGEGLLFFRDGKCMLARKWYGAAATLAVLIVPLGLYLAFVAAQLSRPWDIVAICIGCALLCAAAFPSVQSLPVPQHSTRVTSGIISGSLGGCEEQATYKCWA